MRKLLSSEQPWAETATALQVAGITSGRGMSEIPVVTQHVLYALTPEESRKYGVELAMGRVIWVHGMDGSEPITVNLKVNIPARESFYVRKAPEGSAQGNWRKM